MKFLENSKVGAATRVFVKDPKKFDEEIVKTIKSIRHMLKLNVDGDPMFSRIDALVLGDDRYVDRDCGRTLITLLDEFEDCGTVHIHEFTHGDPFCGALNECMYQQVHGGMDYTMLWSHSVTSYATEDNARAMLEALEGGALVTGMVLKELRESILAGRVLATMKIWNNQAFARIGFYDLRLGQPFETAEKDKPYSPHFMELDGEQVYTVAGVEEIIPLIRMGRMFGRPFIAPIVPRGHGVWDDEPDMTRERKKIDSKVKRQERAVTLEGARLADIRDLVLPAYRNQK